MTARIAPRTADPARSGTADPDARPITAEDDPAREAVIRDPASIDRPPAPDPDTARPDTSGPPVPDQDAPGRGVEETDEPIPEPNEPA
jgi:hypothetical protein